MRSGLSSEAAPRATLDELLSGAARHGLTSLELRAGDGHDVSAATALGRDDGAAAKRTIAAASAELCGYRDTGCEDETALAELSRVLECRILVDSPAVLTHRLGRADLLRASGAAVAVVVRGREAVGDARMVTKAGHDVSWTADPRQEPLGGPAASLLADCGDSLCHIQLLGGGPESVMYEGRGVGELMARLALAGYSGDVVLAPSSPRYHVLWETWLGKRGGWGCGSRTADSSLVTLDHFSLAGDAA